MKLTKKETEGLNKDKKRLEEELRTAVLENRNENDGKTTMNDLFKCIILPSVRMPRQGSLH